MAGFLDKNTRIVDMVLTSHGRHLLAQGDLNFVYWAVFDDEVDYQPVLSTTGSLSTEQVESSIQTAIEDTLVREATTGYRNFNRSGSDFTNAFRPLFTMAQGQQVLPKMRVIQSPLSGSGAVVVKQQKITDLHIQKDEAGNTVQALGPFDRGFERFDSNSLPFEFSYAHDSFPTDHQYEGFLVRVFQSGTEGVFEVGHRHDLQNDSCYNDDLKIFQGGVAGFAK